VAISSAECDYSSSVWPLCTGEYLYQRRFPGAVLSYQTMNFTRIKIEIYVVQGNGLPEGLPQAPDRQNFGALILSHLVERRAKVTG
jgi:hypothetical protein